MAKEKSVNPAQAHRKKEKEKALKKGLYSLQLYSSLSSTGKIEKAVRRTEKVARRNPERLQRQIDELKELRESGRQLNPRDKKLLEELERDVAAVRKARDALGDKAPQFESRRGGGERGRGTGRGRGGERRDTTRHRRDDGNESDSSTTSSVLAIPMPRDTPPPIPPEYLLNRSGHNPNFTPLPSSGSRIPASSGPHPLPPKPSIPERPPAKVVYESAPAIRDLRKEATQAFVPAAVQRKLAAQRGQTGRLLEPEEVDQLEEEGYGASGRGREQRVPRGESRNVTVNAATDIHKASTARDDDAVIADPEQETYRFQHQYQRVQMEEVDDEDG
ncbi:MAG: hypothetical protein M1840_007069 [Geoglossum simile]|nr:MAG: hypothetical protein M1840_007069 [Geoglossum simile]